MTDDTQDQGANHLPKNPAAVALGRLGGRAGTGASKRRSEAHYAKIAGTGGWPKGKPRKPPVTPPP